jgi:hypothetical protein
MTTPTLPPNERVELRNRCGGAAKIVPYFALGGYC